MEILLRSDFDKPSLKAVLFDFDGTLSTLRQGWESIMEPLMVEMIAGQQPADKALIDEVKAYINQTTGIQTIYQMIWLAEKVKQYGHNPCAPSDPWWYKNEYNRRLMAPVQKRKNALLKGEKNPEDFLIKGSLAMLNALRENGIAIYVASGTDDPDVKKEAEVLGLSSYFKEIAGAPLGEISCSKEAVLRKLLEVSKLQGSELAVIGDGKVEIALGREIGAITLGVASNEEKRNGVNAIKRERLIKAGAHAIVGDFEDTDTILHWLLPIPNEQVRDG